MGGSPDYSPAFTLDGLYLGFLSRRTFDPIYDAHSFDLSFPFGIRPYLVTSRADPLPVSGRARGPPGQPPRVFRRCRTPGITVRHGRHCVAVVAVPVDEGRYSGLAAVKGGLIWLAASCPACSARASRTPATTGHAHAGAV